MNIQFSMLVKLDNNLNKQNFMSIRLNDNEKYFWTNQTNFKHDNLIDYCLKKFEEQKRLKNNISSQLIFFFIEDLDTDYKFLFEIGKEEKFIDAIEYQSFCEKEPIFIQWHNYTKELKEKCTDCQISIPDLINFDGNWD